MTEVSREVHRLLPLYLSAVLCVVAACGDDQTTGLAGRVSVLNVSLEDTVRISGQTTRIRVVPFSDDGNRVEGVAFEYRSSDSTVSEVEDDGTVRTLRGGEVRIQVSVVGNPGVRETVDLRVIQAGSIKWVAEDVQVALTRPDVIALGPQGNLYLRQSQSRASGAAVSVDPQGNVRWRATESPGRAPAPLMVRGDGTVVIPGEGALVLDPSDGSRLSRYRESYDHPAGVPGALSADGALYTWSEVSTAIDVTRIEPDGTVAWGFSVSGRERAPTGLSVGPGGEIITVLPRDVPEDDPAEEPGWVALVDPATGELLAMSEPAPESEFYGNFPRPIETTWVSDREGRLYCLSGIRSTTRLVRLEPDLTTISWMVSAPGTQLTEPTLGSDGNVYFIERSDVVAVNQDGSVRWRFPWNEQSFNVLDTGQSPTLTADGTLLVPLGKEVLALDASRGEEIWRTDLTRIEEELAPIDDNWGAVMAPAVADDGTIYLSVRGVENGVIALWGISPLADAPWPTYRADNQRSGRVNMGGAG